jgi:hypothetical protein
LRRRPTNSPEKICSQGLLLRRRYGGTGEIELALRDADDDFATHDLWL